MSDPSVVLVAAFAAGILSGLVARLTSGRE